MLIDRRPFHKLGRRLAGIALSVSVLAGVASTRLAAADDLASVEVKLAAELTGKGAGIRTLYITLYDAASGRPMPYGAMKVALDKDASGTVYKGKLDASNVQVMGGGAAPATLRIKARLDKDGSAGPDGAGDLVGIADQVKRGADLTIIIDKAM